MKKTICILTTGFITVLVLSMCDQRCDLPDYKTRIDDLNVALYSGDSKVQEDQVITTASLHLKMNFTLAVDEYISKYASNLNGFFHVAYAHDACFSDTEGLSDRVVNVSLTCNKAIGDFGAGENLISEMKIKAAKMDYEYSLDVNSWMYGMNNGSNPKPFFIFSAGDYEFTVTTVFSDVEVPEDDYTFTFRLDYASGENPYVVTYPTVRLI